MSDDSNNDEILGFTIITKGFVIEWLESWENQICVFEKEKGVAEDGEIKGRVGWRWIDKENMWMKMER